MSETNKNLVRRVAEDIWSKGNVQLVDELYGKQYVFYNPSLPEPVRGPEAYKQYVTAFRAAFPDFRVKADEIIAEGDRIACRWTVSGTHSGDLKYANMVVPATRKKATWSGISIFHIKEGKCVEEHLYGDELGMRKQLGLVTEAPVKGMHA